MRRAIAIALICACTRGEHRDARDKFNEGVDALVKNDYEAAEKALLDARSSAGVDPELRFRAAYDLGMAYAAHADKVKTGKDADLAKAHGLEQQAVSWFSDAVSQHSGDKDAKANLAIARARAQAMADELAKGEGKLEARLDQIISDQRGVLEDAREVWAKTKQSPDPLAEQAALTHLADVERGIVADAGLIGDLASDEIDKIGKQPEDKRDPKDKQRLVQLENLDQYLMDARGKISEARRKLQDLAAEDAVARAETALVALKRAREQLLDPITVLREVAQDELVLVQQTHAVAEASGGKLVDKPADKPVIPTWLEPPALGDRQSGLRDRVEEIRARIAAAVEHAEQPAGAGSAAEPPKLTEDQAKLVERFAAALPHITAGSGAMDKARAALGERRLADAGEAQRDALNELAKAIEEFADLKQTIDIASETQKELVTLLSPESAKIPAADRANETKDALASNVSRMGRIKELISDQVVQLGKQEQDIEAKAGAGNGSAAADPKQVEAAKQQVTQKKEQLTQAESLRVEADKLIGQLEGAIKANKDPLTPAKAADAKLDELRRLFFNLIEHLQDLIRQQGETRDQTSQASGEDDFTRGPKLPAIAGREDGHVTMAKAITDALAKQADAAAKQPQQEGQIPPKSLSAAADEVRLAQGDMTDAKTTIGKAQTTTTQSMSLDPAVKSEAKAIEHLENALKLLQPPKQQQQDKKDQQQQQQQQQQQDKKDQQQQQQQGGAGQRARDDDARRQREKQQHESQGDPVDKDW